jgi:hypothetical protein
METARDISEGAVSTDPDVGLRAVAALRELTERLEILQIDNARGLGWSWQQIAERLGVTKRPCTASTASGPGGLMTNYMTRDAGAISTQPRRSSASRVGSRIDTKVRHWPARAAVISYRPRCVAREHIRKMGSGRKAPGSHNPPRQPPPPPPQPASI